MKNRAIMACLLAYATIYCLGNGRNFASCSAIGSRETNSTNKKNMKEQIGPIWSIFGSSSNNKKLNNDITTDGDAIEMKPIRQDNVGSDIKPAKNNVKQQSSIINSMFGPSTNDGKKNSDDMTDGGAIEMKPISQDKVGSNPKVKHTFPLQKWSKTSAVSASITNDNVKGEFHVDYEKSIVKIPVLLEDDDKSDVEIKHPVFNDDDDIWMDPAIEIPIDGPPPIVTNVGKYAALISYANVPIMEYVKYGLGFGLAVSLQYVGELTRKKIKENMNRSQRTDADGNVLEEVENKDSVNLLEGILIHIGKKLNVDATTILRNSDEVRTEQEQVQLNEQNTEYSERIKQFMNPKYAKIIFRFAGLVLRRYTDDRYAYPILENSSKEIESPNNISPLPSSSIKLLPLTHEIPNNDKDGIDNSTSNSLNGDPTVDPVLLTEGHYSVLDRTINAVHREATEIVSDAISEGQKGAGSIIGSIGNKIGEAVVGAATSRINTAAATVTEGIQARDENRGILTNILQLGVAHASNYATKAISTAVTTTTETAVQRAEGVVDSFANKANKGLSSAINGVPSDISATTNPPRNTKNKYSADASGSTTGGDPSESTDGVSETSSGSSNADSLPSTEGLDSAINGAVDAARRNATKIVSDAISKGQKVAGSTIGSMGKNIGQVVAVAATSLVDRTAAGLRESIQAGVNDGGIFTDPLLHSIETARSLANSKINDAVTETTETAVQRAEGVVDSFAGKTNEVLSSAIDGVASKIDATTNPPPNTKNKYSAEASGSTTGGDPSESTDGVSETSSGSSNADSLPSTEGLDSAINGAVDAARRNATEIVSDAISKGQKVAGSTIGSMGKNIGQVVAVAATSLVDRTAAGLRESIQAGVNDGGIFTDPLLHSSLSSAINGDPSDINATTNPPPNRKNKYSADASGSTTGGDPSESTGGVNDRILKSSVTDSTNGSVPLTLREAEQLILDRLLMEYDKGIDNTSKVVSTAVSNMVDEVGMTVAAGVKSIAADAGKKIEDSAVSLIDTATDDITQRLQAYLGGSNIVNENVAAAVSAASKMVKDEVQKLFSSAAVGKVIEIIDMATEKVKSQLNSKIVKAANDLKNKSLTFTNPQEYNNQLIKAIVKLDPIVNTDSKVSYVLHSIMERNIVNSKNALQRNKKKLKMIKEYGFINGSLIFLSKDVKDLLNRGLKYVITALDPGIKMLRPLQPVIDILAEASKDYLDNLSKILKFISSGKSIFHICRFENYALRCGLDFQIAVGEGSLMDIKLYIEFTHINSLLMRLIYGSRRTPYLDIFTGGKEGFYSPAWPIIGVPYGLGLFLQFGRIKSKRQPYYITRFDINFIIGLTAVAPLVAVQFKGAELHIPDRWKLRLKPPRPPVLFVLDYAAIINYIANCSKLLKNLIGEYGILNPVLEKFDDVRRLISERIDIKDLKNIRETFNKLKAIAVETGLFKSKPTTQLQPDKVLP